MKARSPAYQFTIDPKSTTDNERLLALKKAVKSINSFAKAEYEFAVKSFKRGYRDEMPAEPKLYRVSQKCRLGRNNPAAPIYRSKPTFWGYGDYQSIKMEHAQRIDVYIHRRS